MKLAHSFVAVAAPCVEHRSPDKLRVPSILAIGTSLKACGRANGRTHGDHGAVLTTQVGSVARGMVA